MQTTWMLNTSHYNLPVPLSQIRYVIVLDFFNCNNYNYMYNYA